MCFTHTFDKQALIDIHPDAFCALYPETQGIRSRQIGIMMQYNGFTIGALHHCRDFITESELQFSIGMFRASFGMIEDIFMQAS